MMGKACAYSPSGWSGAAFSGRRRPVGWRRSALLSCVICSKALIGGCRNSRGDRRRRADRNILNRQHDHGLRPEPSVVILLLVMSLDDSLPTDLASAHALIIVQRAALRASESEAQYRALLIEKLKYNERFGQASERGALLDQLE